MPAVDVNQSALAPAGLQASTIHHLWSLMLWVTTAVAVVVLACIAIAVVRGVRHASDAHDRPPKEKALAGAVGGAVALTVIILFGLLIASISTQRSILSLHASSAVTIEIIGHQWWWEIQYDDAIPARRVTTANEFHIPIGRPVVLKVTSRDVIHSFWVPNLHGKRDLIPGYTTAIWLQADRPGIYRGQCAEFCGLQ